MSDSTSAAPGPLLLCIDLQPVFISVMSDGAGLPVTLLSDCLGARRPTDAAVAIETLRRAGANILPSETVFYSMLHDAKHPFFKTLTQLVKKYG